MNTADNGLQNDLYREVTPKKKKPDLLPRIIVVIVLIGIAAFFLFSDDEPAKVISMPEGAAPAAQTESATSSVIRPAPVVTPAEESAGTASKAKPRVKSTILPRQNPGDSARKLIAGFRAKKGEAGLQQAIESADKFQTKGMYTDAYLLYFFAARGGDSGAAQVLAKMYDPAHHSRQTSMLDQPDLVQAYKWYQQAARGGQATTQNDLNDFRARVEQMAADNSSEAKQLSLQWQ